MKLAILEQVDPTYICLDQDSYNNILHFLTNEGKLSWSEANAMPWNRARATADWHIERLKEEQTERERVEQRQQAEQWVNERLGQVRGL